MSTDRPGQSFSRVLREVFQPALPVISLLTNTDTGLRTHTVHKELEQEVNSGGEQVLQVTH